MDTVQEHSSAVGTSPHVSPAESSCFSQVPFLVPGLRGAHFFKNVASMHHVQNPEGHIINEIHSVAKSNRKLRYPCVVLTVFLPGAKTVLPVARTELLVGGVRWITVRGVCLPPLRRGVHMEPWHPYHTP